MRRLWVTLILSFALVAGGLASASGAFACPAKTPPAAAMHDCCPDEGTSNDGDEGGKQGMMDCGFMQLCRTAPVLAPEAAPIRVEAPAIVVLNAPRADAVFVSAPSEGLFRPPRTI